MTALRIPRKLPSHTRTWLAYIDAAMIERVGDDAANRAAEARRSIVANNGRDGNVHYFLGLYAEMVDPDRDGRSVIQPVST